MAEMLKEPENISIAEDLAAAQDDSPETMRGLARKVKAKFAGAMRHALVESTLDVYGLFGTNFLDPLDFAGDTDQGWGNYPYSSPAYYIQNMKRGEVLPAYLYEQQLRIYRDRSRKLCQENEFAICAVENRKNYAVGAEGFQYKAVSARKERSEGMEKLLSRTQWVIDHWIEHNDLAEYAKDVMLRLDKDGEAFTRYFPQDSGLVSIRTVEAEHVKAPSADYGPHYSFGIQTDPEDIETREGYWIVEDPAKSGWIPSFVPAEHICHIKINTPRSAKRGLPTFYPCEQLLRIASDLLVGVAKNANHRAKIAMVRTVTSAIKDAAQSMLDELKDVNITDPNSGQNISVEKFNWGTILTQPDSVKTEFPNANFESGNFETALQMILRAVGARLIMPEWMLSIDASNGNYSSSMIAEAPSTKAFEDLQQMLMRRFGVNRMRSRESMVWFQLRHAVKVGLLPPEVLTEVKIECQGPSLIVRDKSGEAQQNDLYYKMRAKSKRIIQMENNWDPETVEKDFAEDDAEQMALQQKQMAMQAQVQLQTQQAQMQAEAAMGASPPDGDPNAMPGQPGASNGQGIDDQQFNSEGMNGRPPANRMPTREAVFNEAQRSFTHRGTKILMNPEHDDLVKLFDSEGKGYGGGKGIIDLTGNHYAWNDRSARHHEEIARALKLKDGEWGGLFHGYNTPDFMGNATKTGLRTTLVTAYKHYDPEHEKTILNHAANLQDFLKPTQIVNEGWTDIPADILNLVLMEERGQQDDPGSAIPWHPTDQKGGRTDQPPIRDVVRANEPKPEEIEHLPDYENYTPEIHANLKQAIHESPIVEKARMGFGESGINTAYKAKLADGTTVMHKPKEGEAWSNWHGVPFHKREAAASDIADVLGMHDLVPATVSKGTGNELGSYQHWRNGVTANEHGNTHGIRAKYGDSPEDVGRAAAFDYLIGNRDRHHNNWLISPKNKLVLIDHGISMPNELRPSTGELQHWAEAEKMPIPKEHLTDENWNKIEAAAKSHGIPDEAIGHMKTRFGHLARESHFHHLPDYMGRSRSPLDKTSGSDVLSNP